MYRLPVNWLNYIHNLEQFRDEDLILLLCLEVHREVDEIVEFIGNKIEWL